MSIINNQVHLKESEVLGNLYLQYEQISRAQLQLRIATLMSALIAAGAIGGAVAGVAMHQPYIIIASQFLAWTAIPVSLFLCKSSSAKGLGKANLAKDLDTSHLLEKLLAASQAEQEKMILILAEKRVLNDVLRGIQNLEDEKLESLKQALANQPEDFAKNLLGIDTAFVEKVLLKMDDDQASKFGQYLADVFNNFIEKLDNTTLDKNSKYHIFGRLYYPLAESLGKPDYELLAGLSFQMHMDHTDFKLGQFIDSKIEELDKLLKIFSEEEQTDIFAGWEKFKDFAQN